MMNGGNVRADVPEGDVTLKVLRTVQPFGGALGVVEANGQLILDALEFGAQAVGDGEFGGFLQVAGLTFTVDGNTYTVLPAAFGLLASACGFLQGEMSQVRRPVVSCADCGGFLRKREG